MKEQDLEKTLEVFKNGTELNLGIFPNTNIVKYGYDNKENELTLYIQVSDKESDKIKKYINKNETVNFNKWSKEGYFVNGEGNTIILKTNEEKTGALKKISEQQTKTESNINISENEITNLFLFKIIVNDMTIIKY